MDRPDDVIAKVASIYAQVLDLQVVGPDDDFMTLNGDSHQAVLLALELEAAFGVPVPVETIGDLGTVRRVATWIAEQAASGSGRDTR
ncbi:phosphopantetheine-binding [Methylobacterium sp. 4-46]|uniref:acyl carrier protein n=1 Tax=unclassified Methylobacterium TaxID=2615210 RepID=UPI000152D416|nr:MULTISPECIES: phosphopantetheine-binding protein [Methylobacterium]ACA20354.1 phosphopantetheine-binding [Methylobacterium sp. 4-46]WFT79525.1 phosphopantetheine-binding protein [Methylobacterium nodulans]